MIMRIIAFFGVFGALISTCLLPLFITMISPGINLWFVLAFMLMGCCATSTCAMAVRFGIDDNKKKPNVSHTP